MKRDIGFVLIQFVLFALYIINFKIIDYKIDLPSWIDIFLLILGFVAAVIITMGVINLNENLTPFPSPRRNSSLVSNGIYRHIRHPIYTGIIALMFTYGLYSGSMGRLVITVILIVVFYFKTELEEKLLIKRFPEYRDYRKVAGRFFPRVARK
ncbi:MAG: isoprenylcysteine carboxylmethyltransferase family protein [Bacteroidia bacterium]|nr:isoprenylcysteine carboxylmethyltransferase family protein [Bacteroidia bacterium]NNF30853.1 isoprenylcysteine carboxylmethyltransferase family protein [Flavobacteriaceae bacterium]MBT8275440.1 isoprenylcysteine carboxylmethyltransferase family protein [Bacteroidia bacterium]NNJ82530.1 isoprenylcysteine carboxylmethyltransferase family protein [Flavobacteriaceae bacterium]NNK54466.1 isoprenylcysteine carboxylmethyltransferase family protein [Flavobacteriaceae bacterium]